MTEGSGGVICNLSRKVLSPSGQTESPANDHVLPWYRGRIQCGILLPGVDHNPCSTAGVHMGGMVVQWCLYMRRLLLPQRTVKRLHLSKVKTSKYYDSGCLVVFYLVSVVWGLDIIISSGYATNPPLLWTNYPHSLMRSVFCHLSVRH